MPATFGSKSQTIFLNDAATTQLVHKSAPHLKPASLEPAVESYVASGVNIKVIGQDGKAKPEYDNADEFHITYDVKPLNFAQATMFHHLTDFYTATLVGNAMTDVKGPTMIFNNITSDDENQYNLHGHYVTVMRDYIGKSVEDQKHQFRNKMASWRNAGYRCAELDSGDSILEFIRREQPNVRGRLKGAPAILWVSLTIGTSALSNAFVAQLRELGVRVITYPEFELAENKRAPFQCRFFAAKKITQQDGQKIAPVISKPAATVTTTTSTSTIVGDAKLFSGGVKHKFSADDDNDNDDDDGDDDGDASVSATKRRMTKVIIVLLIVCKH
jgi:hypothetical protein